MRPFGVVIAGGLHLASVLTVRGTLTAQCGVRDATERTTTGRHR